ncbi:MAG: hypothetical protein R3D02_11850 [Hyphomicrobiales bacterium]
MTPNNVSRPLAGSVISAKDVVGGCDETILKALLQGGKGRAHARLSAPGRTSPAHAARSKLGSRLLQTAECGRALDHHRHRTEALDRLTVKEIQTGPDTAASWVSTICDAAMFMSIGVDLDGRSAGIASR